MKVVQNGHDKWALRSVRDFFIPQFDRLTAFLLALIWWTLISLDAELRTQLLNLFDLSQLMHRDRGALFMLGLLFWGGFLVAISQIFSHEKLGMLGKICLLTFVLGLNGVSAVVAAAHQFREAGGLLIIFPIWNCVNGLILLWYLGMADESRIGDVHPSPVQISVGIIAAGATLAACRYFLEWHWSITLSVCVAYAMNISRFVEQVWLKLRQILRHKYSSKSPASRRRVINPP